MRKNLDNNLFIKDNIFDMWMCELLSLYIISQIMGGEATYSNAT